MPARETLSSGSSIDWTTIYQPARTRAGTSVVDCIHAPCSEQDICAITLLSVSSSHRAETLDGSFHVGEPCLRVPRHEARGGKPEEASLRTPRSSGLPSSTSNRPSPPTLPLIILYLFFFCSCSSSCSRQIRRPPSGRMLQLRPSLIRQRS